MEELVIESPHVILTTPLYNVTRMKLVSGRILNNQLLINEYNNTFVVSGTEYQIPLGTYKSGKDLETAFNSASSGVTSSYDSNTNALSFSGDFEPNPWLATILGYPGGQVNLEGPEYITLRVTIGKDILSQKVQVGDSDCHHLGKILTGPIGEMIRYTSAFDTVEMETQIKSIQTLSIDFLNPNGTVYHVSQPWILKFHLSCSTDKLSVTSRDTASESVLPPQVLWTPDNKKFVLTAAFALLVLGLMFLLMR
jgi:hypothetical protein